ncbi:FtsH protease activity modulator HflK [Bartonella sp. HY038]|uniref:FtsH protease activity modulator HflK n=1 Tax=Bartonella sp. HY038 TaxID=2759660 RepID=UPI0015FE69F7|nr:FtsH protease activity modulator HflK [Bartonella sp. HY038]
MPWSNQSGGSGPLGGSESKSGPWGGGNNNDGNKSPWGRPNGSGNNGNNGSSNGGSGGNNGGGKNGPTPPDMDDLLRKGQQKLQQFGGGMIVFVIIVLAVIFVAYKSIFFVQPNEKAIKLRFGVPQQQILSDGMHFRLWPIEDYVKTGTAERNISIGNDEVSGLMLTSDQNIVNVKFALYFNVTHPEEFLFNVSQPIETIKQVAESAMREVVGRRPMNDVLRDKRPEIAREVVAIIANTLNQYKVGVTLKEVAINDAAPPKKVMEAFNLVQQAEQQRNQMVSTADQYRNKKEGEAQGEVSRLVEAASAYKARVIAEADGRAQRFRAIAQEEKNAPDATRYRIYVDTMEQVLSSPNKLVIDKGNSGVVPYLPLNNMLRAPTSSSATSTTTTNPSIGGAK